MATKVATAEKVESGKIDKAPAPSRIEIFNPSWGPVQCVGKDGSSILYFPPKGVMQLTATAISDDIRARIGRGDLEVRSGGQLLQRS